MGHELPDGVVKFSGGPLDGLSADTGDMNQAVSFIAIVALISDDCEKPGKQFHSSADLVKCIYGETLGDAGLNHTYQVVRCTEAEGRKLLELEYVPNEQA